ncbi:MAG: hypothetical protein HY391_04080, partial [Deltaproteobacteria bacterium]|nr:hypothetical protein [Deltaproteobacteria bacterium]
ILEKAGSFLLGPLGYSVAQKGYWRIIRPAQKILTDQLKPVSELLLPPLSTLPKVHYRNGTIDVDDLAFDLVWSDNRLALYSKEKDVAIDLNEASIKLKDPLLAIPFIEDLAQKISLEKVGHLKDIFGTSKAYAFGMDPVSLASIVAVALLLMILKVLIIAAILTIALPLYADYSARPDHFVADQLTRERLRDEDFFQKTVRNLDTVVQDGKRKYSGEEYRREIISECHEILQAHFAGAFSEEASTYYARVLYILSRYSDDPHSLEVIDSFQKEAEPWVRGEEREQLLSCIQRAGAEIELRSQAVQR